MSAQTKSVATPGPWILNGASARIEASKGVLIAVPVFVEKDDSSTTYGDSQNLANAKLIAAAPELLEALERILSDANSDDYEGGFSEAAHLKAKTAINKAKGQ